MSVLLWSLVTVAGALAPAQRAYAAVAIGSVHFTSTAAMALQNAQQVQSIMLTHHDVEQHAHIGLVHDGDGLCTLCLLLVSGSGSFLCLDARTNG